MRLLWRDRDLRLLTLGLTAGMAGDSIMLLALAIWAKTLTGSDAAAGLVLLCLAAPCAAAPLAGRLLDHGSRRRVLIAANLASALILLPLLTVHDPADTWILYAVAAQYGALLAVGAAALNGLLGQLLDERHLATANGGLQTIKEGLRIAGPLTGAALFAAAGGAAAALADAATFLIAAACVAAIRPPEPATPTPPARPAGASRARAGRTWRAETSAGVRHLMDDPALRRVTTASALAWLALGLGEPVSFAVVDRGLHRPAAFIGVLACAQGVAPSPAASPPPPPSPAPGRSPRPRAAWPPSARARPCAPRPPRTRPHCPPSSPERPSPARASPSPPSAPSPSCSAGRPATSSAAPPPPPRPSPADPRPSPCWAAPPSSPPSTTASCWR
ncbi:MFS transporter [Actinomadura roseirufa]|uniref:MFS transporter n=1 Tax=Actinomadura roseirufa TaxID=2094049 RepID=UPI0010419D71|nr:MFS transporter [Actinomadura roseirufa]